LTAKENPENIFSGRDRNFRKIFSNKSVHALTHRPELFPDTPKLQKNLSKTQFSDVIAIAGSQGHLQPVSPEKPAIINAKKRCPQKPAILHGFIRFKMGILAK
jgi:hypothetical protein